MDSTQLIRVENKHGEWAEFQIPAERGMDFSRDCHRLGLTITDIIERPICYTFADRLEVFVNDRGEEDE